MMAIDSQSNRAVDALSAVLPRTARVHRDRGEAASSVTVTVNDQRLRLAWLGEGRLADVRRVAAQRRDRPDVVVARTLSPGARATLSQAGIGWVDETGAAEIETKSLVIARSGAGSVPPARPSGWTPAVLAAAEAALCGTSATTAAMRAATGLSTGSCVNALRVLTDLGLLRADRQRGRSSGRQLTDRDRLLDAYAVAAQTLAPTASVEVGVTWRDLAAGVQSVGAKWSSAGVHFALTGVLAADRIAPFLTSVATVDIYVSADGRPGLEVAARIAGLRAVPGGRLTLRPFPTVAVDRLAVEVDGLRLAPWPRIYVDLQASGVRGEDAAEHLRESIHGR